MPCPCGSSHVATCKFTSQFVAQQRFSEAFLWCGVEAFVWCGVERLREEKQAEALPLTAERTSGFVTGSECPDGLALVGLTF